MRLNPPSNSSKNLLSSGHSGTMNGNDQSVRYDRADAARPDDAVYLPERANRIGQVLGDRAGEDDVELAVVEGQVVDVRNLVLEVVQPAVGYECVCLVDHRRLDVDAHYPPWRNDLRETQSDRPRPAAAVEHAHALRQARYQEIGDLDCVSVRVAPLHVGRVVSVERPASELRG